MMGPIHTSESPPIPQLQAFHKPHMLISTPLCLVGWCLVSITLTCCKKQQIQVCHFISDMKWWHPYPQQYLKREQWSNSQQGPTNTLESNFLHKCSLLDRLLQRPDLSAHPSFSSQGRQVCAYNMGCHCFSHEACQAREIPTDYAIIINFLMNHPSLHLLVGTLGWRSRYEQHSVQGTSSGDRTGAPSTTVLSPRVLCT